MAPTILTPTRVLAAGVAVWVVLVTAVLTQRPSPEETLVERVGAFTATYDLMQRDLNGVASVTDGLAILDAGAADLQARVDELRPLQSAVTGSVAQPSADLLASAQQLVDSLGAYGAALREGDLRAAKRRLDEESRARAAYDQAASELL